jgi:glycosyltransferase involved in cell wall biosynthesis
VHRKWGTDGKVTVIPNWAPLDEIVPVSRENSWSSAHDFDGVHTLLYSGTLGLKHNPALLPALARQVIDRGTPVHLVVVTEGPAVPVLRSEADRLGVPLTVLPFQPYDQLSNVLGSGDVLVVLLEQSAGEFSVPSKTLSYLCAGRPILGLMPSENLAAALIERVEGCVLAPAEGSLPEAAAWVADVLADGERGALLGKKGRALAEDQFALGRATDRFLAVLQHGVRRP